MRVSQQQQTFSDDEARDMVDLVLPIRQIRLI
jgi:hypothetical protein